MADRVYWSPYDWDDSGRPVAYRRRYPLLSVSIAFLPSDAPYLASVWVVDLFGSFGRKRVFVSRSLAGAKQWWKTHSGLYI